MSLHSCILACAVRPQHHIFKLLRKAFDEIHLYRFRGINLFTDESPQGQLHYIPACCCPCLHWLCLKSQVAHVLRVGRHSGACFQGIGLYLTHSCTSGTHWLKLACTATTIELIFVCTSTDCQLHLTCHVASSKHMYAGEQVCSQQESAQLAGLCLTSAAPKLCHGIILSAAAITHPFPIRYILCMIIIIIIIIITSCTIKQQLNASLYIISMQSFLAYIMCSVTGNKACLMLLS